MKLKHALASTFALAAIAGQASALTPAPLITLNAINADPDTVGATGLSGAVYSGGNLYVLVADSNAGSQLVQVNSPSDVSVVMSASEWNTDGPGGFASTGNFLGAFADGTFVFPTIANDAVFAVSPVGDVSTLSPTADLNAVTNDTNVFLQYSSYNPDSDSYYFFNNDTNIGASGFYRVTQSGVETEVVDNSVLSTLSAGTGAAGDFDVEGLAVTGAAGSETIYYGSNDFDSIYRYDAATMTGSKVIDLASELGGTAGLSTAFSLGPDGLLYFYETTSDSIMSLDPNALDVASTLSVVLSEAEIISGAGNDVVGQLIFDADGLLNFTINSAGGGGIIGVYAVPEPTTAALLALGGLAVLRRRRA